MQPQSNKPRSIFPFRGSSKKKCGASSPGFPAGVSAPATPRPSPAELTDAELLAATRGLVGRSNQLLAALLAHLGEVEVHGIHRTRACSSLYTYCIYELRFSEDAEENLSEVLLRAKYRTKKEIARIVRQLDPVPDVPARIEPLGPALARVASSARFQPLDGRHQ